MTCEGQHCPVATATVTFDPRWILLVRRAHPSPTKANVPPEEAP